MSVDETRAGERAQDAPGTTLHAGDYIADASAVPVYARVEDVGGDDVTLHGHDFLEIAVVAAGSGTHLTSAGRRAVAAGDVFVLRPGAWHGFVDSRRLVIANCCLAASALSRDIAFLRDVPALRELLWTGPVTSGRHGVLTARLSPEHARDLGTQIRELSRELAAAPRNRVLLLGRLLTVLGGLVERLEPGVEGSFSPAAAGTTAPSLPTAVARAVDLLEADPQLGWQADQLAARVNLDPAYLTRLFRRHLGLPPIAYLARIRAERAAALLARTELPMSRVGALVGWPDPTYFARRFRTLRGITPSDYRQRLQAPTP